MKFTSASFAMIAFLALSSPAFAAMDTSATDYTGSNVSMGDTHIGQWGTIYGTVDGLFNRDFGTIPVNSTIYFSYTAPGATTARDVAQGGYAFSSGGIYYYGSSIDSNTSDVYSVGMANGSLSTPLVIAAADMTSAVLGTTSITNNSSTRATFISLIATLGITLGEKIIATYYIASPVPLPAALPLFVFGLTGLLVAKRKKTLAA